MKKKHFHFIGIGGVGQSGIAQMLHQLDFVVSGSDVKENEVIRKMQESGVNISIGHRARNVLPTTDVLVVSTAISPSNPELIFARKNNIPVISRGEMLGILMRTKKGIAVSGTHGKTTTTSLISILLMQNNFSPTIIIGGDIIEISGNAKLGEGEFLVAEVDESDNSFLHLTPFISVVTNIEEDHLEHHKNLKNIISSFKKFINKTHPAGVVILCNDDKNIKKIIPQIKRKYLTYGLTPQADIYAQNIFTKQGKTIFDIYHNQKFLVRMKIIIPGMHNVHNALATTLVGIYLGIKPPDIVQALSRTKGADRRFQMIGKVGGVTVIDDYAHHPTEIKATLSGVGKRKGKVIAVFQPHRYTRTYFFLKSFATSFKDADVIIIDNIYPASEKPIKGISGKILADKIREQEKEKIVKYFSKRSEIVKYLVNVCRKNDIILTLGAGDVGKIGQDFIENYDKIKEECY